MLEREIRFFEEHRPELLKHHQNKFVVIYQEHIVGTFDDAETAYAAGVKEYGNTAFLVRQVLENEPVEKYPALSLGLMNADSQSTL